MDDDEAVPLAGARGSDALTDGPPFPHLPPPPVVMPPPVTPVAEGLPPIAWVAIAVGMGLPALLGLLGFLAYVVYVVLAIGAG